MAKMSKKSNQMTNVVKYVILSIDPGYIFIYFYQQGNMNWNWSKLKLLHIYFFTFLDIHLNYVYQELGYRFSGAGIHSTFHGQLTILYCSEKYFYMVPLLRHFIG